MIEQSVRITNPTGLHARPAVKLTQLLAGFDADVQLKVAEGDWIKARSVAKVMKLKAVADTVLHIRVNGKDASAALQALVDFVNRDFDEGPRANGHANRAVIEAVTPELNLNGQLSSSDYKNLTAEVASPGIAIGKLFVRSNHQFASVAQGTPEQEREKFDVAMIEAKKQLEHLTKNSDQLASEIIAFQLELLNDGEFLSLARESISQNHTAVASWQHLLDNEVLEYDLSNDEYFKGRAADLRDLRERVLGLLSGAPASEGIPEGSILVTEELTPSKFLELDWNKLVGVVTTGGSYTAHVSMLARAKNVPFIIGLKVNLESLPKDAEAILVAEDKGMLLISPDTETRKRYETKIESNKQQTLLAQSFLEKETRTATGERVRVYINVDDPAQLSSMNAEHCDGIGLTRTELLFYDNAGLPDEGTQYGIYKRLLEWAQGKPVTIRTLDAGGDKPIPGYTLNEANPFLGVRGLRLSLAKSDVFKVQLRALARAAVHGNLKVMFPMVSIPSELAQAKQLFNEQVAELQNANIPCALPKLGMMIEVPAAALRVADFATDFYSIGSNDLIQYVMAAGRDSSGLGHLQDALNPAILELIERVAKHGAAKGLEVSVCGEMASQQHAIHALLRAGINTLSVSASRLAMVKLEVSRYGGH